MTKMTRTLTALAAAATLGIAAVAAPQPAEARNGGAIAAGVIGGLAAGAIIGSAIGHGPYYAYAPGPYYYGAATAAVTGPVSGFGTAGAGEFDQCEFAARV